MLITNNDINDHMMSTVSISCYIASFEDT